MLRAFRLSPAGSDRGISCDANGAFLGVVPLLKRSSANGRETWQPRECSRLSTQVSANFGLPIDMSLKMGGLKAISNALNNGDIARAQIATVLLGIPDPPPLAKGARSREALIEFIRDLHWSGMIKADWNPDEHPRWQAGAPDSQGGQFAPMGGNTDATASFGSGSNELAAPEDSFAASENSSTFLQQGLQDRMLDDGVYRPSSNPAELDQIASRTASQSSAPWRFARPQSPDTAPNKIDLSHLDPEFQSLMAQSFPNGKPLERGGTLFTDAAGNISIGNIVGLGSSDEDFKADLSSPPGLAAVGFFHTHPYYNGLSQPFSGADVAWLIDDHMGISVVQSDGGNQWLLLSTTQSPTGSLDPVAVEQWAEHWSPPNLNSTLYERTQYAVVITMARQYHMAFYAGRDGVFTRVYPPNH